MDKRQFQQALALARIIASPDHQHRTDEDDLDPEAARYLQRRRQLEPVEEEEVVGDDEYAPSLAPQVEAEFAHAEEDGLDQAARLSASMGSSSDLDVKVAIRDQKWRALRDGPEGAKWVRITPPSVLRGSLGNQARVTTDPLVEQVAQVALWQGEDSETTVATITAGPVELPTFDPTAGGPFPTLRPFGRVLWGVRGWMYSMDYDLARGCQFSLEGSSFALLVGLEASAVQGSLQLGAQLGFLPIEKSCMMTRTRYIDAAGGGSTTRVTVPAFAKQLWLLRTPVTEPITINFIDSTGASVGQVALIANQFMADPVPLPNDCVEIQVADGAMAGFTARCIFGLSC